MKNIIKKVLVGVLAAVVVLGVAVWALFTHNPNKPNTGNDTPVVTDAAGTTYYQIVDPDTGKEFVVVTDAAGDRYKAEFDGQNVGVTVEKVNDQVALDKLPSNYNGPHVDASASGNYQGSTKPVESSAQNTASAQTTQGTQTTQGAQTTAPATTEPEYKFLKYQEIFASGNYLMEINDEEMGNVTMAMKNGNMFVKADMEGFGSISLIYQKNSNKWYMLIDKLKKYSEVPDDMLGDMDPSEFSGSFEVDDDPGKVTVSAVDVNGQLLTCESSIDDNGNTLNYYFDGDMLVRQDSISPDGTVSSTYFNKITTDVPDSTFEIPSNYGYWNLKWIMNAMGGTE
ncbi:MAG: hypothetical protein ACI4GC_04935 [Acutalibacteraceae bacterium]